MSAHSTNHFRVMTLCAAAMAASASSCSSVDDKTQVTIALSSETQIPKELDSFTVRVFSTRTGELRFSQDYRPETGDFPTTLAVIPLDSSSLDSPLRIELEGRHQDATFLTRRSVVSYVKDRNLLLEMPLRMACFSFQGCGPTQTCAGGQCVSAETGSLPDFDPNLVFPQAKTCFAEDTCLDTSFQAEVQQDCSFALPPGLADGQGNVSIRWAAAPDRILTLGGGDPQEGWTRPSADRGQLSQGTCDSHFQRVGPDGQLLVADWAKSVYVSSQCQTKTSRQPFCVSTKTLQAGIGALAP